MNLPVKSVPFFDYNIFSGKLEEIDILTPISTPVIINTINPHSFYIADRDEKFKTALLNSTLLLPDGIGIVYANALINFQIITKIAGEDIFFHILRLCEYSSSDTHKRVMFFGASPQVPAKIQKRIKHEYPSLIVQTFSPPFRKSFSENENIEFITTINEFHPFVLFVGMTAPKQEKWVYAVSQNLNADVICSIGAVFDFYAGTIQRPGKFWRLIGLEWAVRLVKEPKRLWKRSLISLPYFIYKALSLFWSRQNVSYDNRK